MNVFLRLSVMATTRYENDTLVDDVLFVSVDRVPRRVNPLCTSLTYAPLFHYAFFHPEKPIYDCLQPT